MNAKELVLRIVSLNDVVLHEQIENKRVEKLIERLKQDRLLKNPPIVSEFQDKYIVLDGASRTTALRQMNCRDVVVQIVDYTAPGIVLETWNHMLLDAPV
ncbi:MAG: ParB N-terminal domain-containing protein, partial [Chloroflexi bacterium]|nr:ParB N-terminal domain-containing protein [Chloroflexota bacterium]